MALIGIPTYENVLENGRPLSRANAHVKRDTDAKILKRETNRMNAIMTTSRFVACLDFVA